MRYLIPLTAAALTCAAMLAQIPRPTPQDIRVSPGTAAPKDERPAPPKPEIKTVKPQAPAYQPPVDPDDTPLIRATVNVVLVPTTVTDGRGAVVNGLQPQDFTLYDNEKPQEINRDVAFLPLSMVVCIQRSEHVEQVLPKIQKMGDVMHSLLVGQDGEAAIISFGNNVDVIQEFTNDAEKINRAVSTLRASGRNNRLNDAVNQATYMLRNKRDRRKVILLISETLDRSSEARPREVATNLQVHNIDLYTLNISRIVTLATTRPDVPRPDPLPPGARPRVGIGPMDPTSQAQISGTFGYGGDLVPALEEIFRGVKGIFIKNPAELYTRFTGGREMSFLTQADLERAITDIGAEIRSQYLLSYTPNNKMEGGFHKIRVEVNRRDLKIRTRPGYWMAAIPE